VFHLQARLGGTGKGGPLGHSGLHVRARSQAGVTASTEHKSTMSVAAGVEHEAASMLTALSLSVFQIDMASQQQHAPVAACGQQECTARHDPSLLLLMAASVIIFSHKRARSNWDPTIEARGSSTHGHINLSNYNSEQQVLGSSIKSHGGGCSRCGACRRATGAGRPCTSIAL
jgi:hypothetical protein